MVVLLVSHQQVANADEDGQQQEEGYLQVGRHCLLELLPLAMQLHRPLLMPMPPMVPMSSLVMHSLGVRGRLEVGEAGHLAGLLIPMLVLHPYSLLLSFQIIIQQITTKQYLLPCLDHPCCPCYPYDSYIDHTPIPNPYLDYPYPYPPYAEFEIILILMMRTITKGCNSLRLAVKYGYTPVSNYEIQNKVNPVVAITLGNNKQTLDLHFRLFENVVPRTAENFKRLLLGTANYNNRALSLIGNHFHNVVPRSYAELGHFEEGNCSIFGPTFRDESFELPHDRAGLLSCVSEENTCNSRLLITFAPCPFLDLRNVVFGEVTAETFQNLRALQKLGNKLQNYKILSTELLDIQEEPHH